MGLHSDETANLELLAVDGQAPTGLVFAKRNPKVTLELYILVAVSRVSRPPNQPDDFEWKRVAGQDAVLSKSYRESPISDFRSLFRREPVGIRDGHIGVRIPLQLHAVG